MRKVVFLLTLVLLAGLFVVPVAAQEELPEWLVHTECEVDLSGETLTLYHIGDLSGPYAPITQPLLAGLDDAVAYFNDRGGICGALIALPDPTTIDTASDQEQTSVIYSRVSSEDPLLIVLYNSDDSELLRDRLAEDEIPVLLSAGSIEGLYGGEEDGYDAPGWIFATNPLYVDELAMFCDYAAANLEDPVIGYISWPTAFGRAAFTPETIAYCDSVGVGFVEEPELFAPGSDITGQIQNLIDGGANILYTNTLATGPAEIAATVANMGLRDQVTLAGVHWAMDTSVGFLGMATMGPDGLPSVNGQIGSLPLDWWSEVDKPNIALMTEQADLNERSPIVRNLAYMLGWGAVDLFIEVAIQSANRVGADALDGAAMYETMTNLEYTSLNALLDFTDGNRDANLNRMAMMAYLGQDGGPAVIPDNPPVVVETDSGPMMIPILVPLTEYEETQDMRPGMMGE